MPENISTYWAKNVKIKTLRGNKFEFVLNVKNEDGSNYIFPEGHVAFFAAFKTTNVAAGLIMPTDTGSATIFDTLVEEGKITVNTFGNESGFWAVPGTYSYVLFTYNPDDVGANLTELLQNQISNYHLRVGWMSSELSEIWTNPNETDDDILSNGYYHQWFHLVGEENLFPCYIPDWAPLKANQEDGDNLYYSEPLVDYPYVGFDYLDNAGVWNGNRLTYSSQISELLMKLIIQKKNILPCVFDTTFKTKQWSVVPVPVGYNAITWPPNYLPEVQYYPSTMSTSTGSIEQNWAWTVGDTGKYQFSTGHLPVPMVFGPEGSAIPPPQTAQDLAQGLSSIYFAANYLYNSVANVLTEPVQVTDLSQYYSQQSNLGDSDVFEFTQAFNAENFGVSGGITNVFESLATDYQFGDVLWYPMGSMFNYYQLGYNENRSFYGNNYNWADNSSGITNYSQVVNSGQGFNDWRRIRISHVGLPYAPVETLEEMNDFLNTPTDWITQMFYNNVVGDAFPWFSYVGTSGSQYVGAQGNSSSTGHVWFLEGTETNWNLNMVGQSGNAPNLVPWDEDYLIYPKTSYFLDMYQQFPELGHYPSDGLNTEQTISVMQDTFGNPFPTSSYEHLPQNTNTPGWNLIPYLGIDATMYSYFNSSGSGFSQYAVNNATAPGFILGSWQDYSFETDQQIEGYNTIPGGGGVVGENYSYYADSYEAGYSVDLGLTQWGSPIHWSVLKNIETTTETFGPYFDQNGDPYVFGYDNNGDPITTWEQTSTTVDNQYDDEGNPVVADIATQIQQSQELWASQNQEGWMGPGFAGFDANQWSYPIPSAVRNFLENATGLDGELYPPWWTLKNEYYEDISSVKSIFSNGTYYLDESPINTAEETGIYDMNDLPGPEFEVYISGYITNAISEERQFYSEAMDLGDGPIFAECRITRPDGSGFPVIPEFDMAYSQLTYSSSVAGNSNEPGAVANYLVNINTAYAEVSYFGSDALPYGLGYETEVYGQASGIGDPTAPTTIIPKLTKAVVFKPIFKDRFDELGLTHVNPVKGEPGAYEFTFKFAQPYAGFSPLQFENEGGNDETDSGFHFIDWDNMSDRKFVVEYKLLYFRTMPPPFMFSFSDYTFLNMGYTSGAGGGPFLHIPSVHSLFGEGMDYTLIFPSPTRMAYTYGITLYEDTEGDYHPFETASTTNLWTSINQLFNPQVYMGNIIGAVPSDSTLYAAEHFEIPIEVAPIHQLLLDNNESSNQEVFASNDENLRSYWVVDSDTFGDSSYGDLLYEAGMQRPGSFNGNRILYDSQSTIYTLSMSYRYFHAFAIELGNVPHYTLAPTGFVGGHASGLSENGFYSSAAWGQQIPRKTLYTLGTLYPDQCIWSDASSYNTEGPYSTSGHTIFLDDLNFELHYLNETTGETGPVESRDMSGGEPTWMTQADTDNIYVLDNVATESNTLGHEKNINTPEHRRNFIMAKANDTPIHDQTHYNIEGVDVLNTTRWASGVKVNNSPIYPNEDNWAPYLDIETLKQHGRPGRLQLPSPTSYYNQDYDYNNTNYNYGFSLPSRSKRIFFKLPKNPDWNGHLIKLFYKTQNPIEPRIFGGPTLEHGGKNPYADGERMMIIDGECVKIRAANRQNTWVYLTTENCMWKVVYDQNEDWIGGIDENGNRIPVYFNNPSWGYTGNTGGWYGGMPGWATGYPYCYWTIGGGLDSLQIQGIRTAKKVGHFADIEVNAQPSEIIEKRAEIRAKGVALVMDLMELHIGVPPDFSIFDYTIKVTRADDPEYIYAQFEVNAGLELEDYTSTSVITSQVTMNIGEYGIPDGEEIEFHMKPMNYRQVDTSQESYIRLAGTYFSTTWGNESFFDEKSLTPSPANYWLYGDFVVEKRNDNLN